MLNALLFAVIALAGDAQSPPKAAHICWIDHVVTDGAGVRIVFTDGAPVRDGREVHGDVGAVFSPATSGHDGCRITVARRGGQLGVSAQAHFFAYAIMKEPEIRTEWIAAHP